MGSFAEAAFHSAGKMHTLLAELVAQTVSGGEGFLPALAAIVFQKISLPCGSFETRNVHAQQTDLNSLLPVLAKQRRICSKISVSSWVAEGSEWARVMVVKSL